MSAALLLALPIAMFALLAVCWPLRHTGRFAGMLSAAVAVACFGIAVALFASGRSELYEYPWLVRSGHVIASVGWRLDPTSASMLIVVTAVAACVQIYSLGYLSHEPPKDLGRYFAWQSLFIFAMVGLVVAPNLLQLVGCWELVGLCSYLLIGYWWRKPSAGKAAVKAVWVTRFADIGLMTGIVVLYGATGGFAWDHVLAPQVATAVAALLFVGVMGKSAQMPLHVWLPDAMEGPTPVSALLHAATMVAAGVYLVVRAWPIFHAAPDVLLVMSWVGGVTAFTAACIALVQTDIKKVLAYSTCSQLGYMIAGLGSGEMLGGYLHLTTHAFFKALLFLAAGSVIHATGTNDIREMGGLWRKAPWTAGLFGAGTLALAGIPGFAGFFSKDLLLEELFEAGRYGPLVLCLAGAGLTAFYMTRVMCLVFFGEQKERVHHAHESPFVMLAPMLFLSVPAVAAGWFAGPFAERLGLEYHFSVTPVGGIATIFALGGVGLGVARYGIGQLTWLAWPAAATFLASAPVDRLWAAAWRQGLLPFARAAGWFDRYVVDGLINLSGWVALEGGERLRLLQTGKVRDYVYAAVVGVVLLAAWGAMQ